MKFIKKIAYITLFIGICFVLVDNIFLEKYATNYIYAKKEINIDNIKKFEIENVFGDLKIVKGDNNSVKLRGKFNAKIDGDTLKLDAKKYSHKNNLHIYITYNSDDIEVEIENLIGKAFIELPDISDVHIDNLIGEASFKTKTDVDLSTQVVLGNIYLDAVNTSSSYNKIKINNTIGNVKIYE